MLIRLTGLIWFNYRSNTTAVVNVKPLSFFVDGDGQDLLEAIDAVG